MVLVFPKSVQVIWRSEEPCFPYALMFQTLQIILFPKFPTRTSWSRVTVCMNCKFTQGVLSKVCKPLHCTSPFLIQEACQQLSGNFQNVKYSSDSDFVQGKLLGALLLLSLSVLALGFHPQDVPLLPSILPWNPFLAWVAFSLEYTSHIFYKFHSSTSLLFFYPNPVLLSLPNAEPL